MEKDREWSVTYRIFDGSEDLGEEEQKLWNEAGKAFEVSYSPYSSFPVGAALLLEDGRIVRGSNQENAAYPSSICAERVAVWKAATDHPDKEFRTLAIRTSREEHSVPVSPCGACRQVLSEYEERFGGSLQVLFPGEGGRIISVEKVRDLLPFPFEPASIQEDEKGS